MNKLGKAKEMGILGTILTIILFIFIGFTLITNNTATDNLGKQSIDFIGGGFLLLGLFSLLILIISGIIWLIKELE